MGIRKFKVEFENVNRCYLTGETIRGQVAFETKKKKILKGLKIHFEGNTIVSWMNSDIHPNKNGRPIRETVQYREVEPHFSTDIFLANEVDGKGIVIGSGCSIFPFMFTIPENIPSSYIGKVGQVHYYAQVILNYKGNEYKQKFPLSINGLLDLNFEPGVTQATNLRKYKRSGCIFFRSGPIGFFLTLPKTGYVPGEPVVFNTEISNHSTRKVKDISLHLLQRVEFHVKGDTFSDERIIRTIHGPMVGPGDTENWNKDFLRIPPLPPTRLASSNIIDVQYFLQVEMEISGITFNLVGEVRICIGTIPLKGTFRNLRLPLTKIQPMLGIEVPIKPSEEQTELLSSTSEAEHIPTRMEATSLTRVQHQKIVAIPATHDSTREVSSPSILQLYPELPPPSYEEAINVQGSSTNDGKKAFTNVALKTGQRRSKVSSRNFRANKLTEDVDKTENSSLPSFSPLYITYTWKDD